MKIANIATVKKFDIIGDLGDRYGISIGKQGKESIFLYIDGDAGNYSFLWNSTGIDPYIFISKLSFDYFWEKMINSENGYVSKGYDIDKKETIKNIKKLMEDFKEIHLQSYPGDEDEINDEMSAINETLNNMNGNTLVEDFERYFLSKCELLSDYLDDELDGAVVEKENERKRYVFESIKKISKALFYTENHDIKIKRKPTLASEEKYEIEIQNNGKTIQKATKIGDHIRVENSKS